MAGISRLCECLLLLINRWRITAMAITKRNIVNKKISQIKKFCSHIKKVCFHINKICSHIQKRYAYKYKKPTANSRSKSLRQILAANSHGKFLRQIPTANPAANSHGKFSRRVPTANSRICKAEDCVEYPLCGRASQVKIKRKQITKQKFIKA